MGEVLGGRYELVDPLGEGGAGVVWRAWDHRELRYVAAKVMRQADAHSLLRFVREQAVRIGHPHVLTPLGWVGEDDRVLLIMPIVDGGSVATLVGDHGPLPPAWVATLLDQLLAALERIHAEGLVHRDVKPANLLLDATGTGLPRARLADFGIAAAVDQPRLTQVAHVVGTVGYAAPETLSPGWDPDPRADLYAAGMTAAEMLLGERPGEAQGARVGVVHATSAPVADRTRDLVVHLTRDLVRAHVPTPLLSVVLDLAAPDPLDRYPDAEAARAALRGTGLVADASTWDAGEVEVFDHVPPLPEGWGQSGPAPASGPEPRRGASAVSTRPGVLPAAEPVPRPAAVLRTGVLMLVVGLMLIGAAVLVALLG
ncbi:serine/threonine-protein kinase [Ornithinimicrobium flavum]|uniref:serine/threonine-protein kinase n=1 Tax=Ornithinimicrobium flavum TaxID=1288636 RepID=UPI00107051C7|nr:serine/threonine-protein kinase [Ornithinimicrobium flavum]